MATFVGQEEGSGDADRAISKWEDNALDAVKGTGGGRRWRALCWGGGHVIVRPSDVDYDELVVNDSAEAAAGSY